MSQLFSPHTLKSVTFRNRIAVSPMSQYRAQDGVANDWHLVHLGRFAMGGAGLVFAEATAVTEDGRRTHGDLGLWNDDQIEPLTRIATFLEAEGAVPGIQLGHAGRKSSERRPSHAIAEPLATSCQQSRASSVRPCRPAAAFPRLTEEATCCHLRIAEMRSAQGR